jgi:hypothetical protein
MVDQPKPKGLPRTRSFKWYVVALIPLLLASIVAAQWQNWGLSYPFGANNIQNRSLKRVIASIPTVKDLAISPLPTKRSTLLEHGARVACWPSSGGVWIKHAPPAELDFLNLSRTNDTDRPEEKIYEHVRTCPQTSPDVYHPPPITEEDLFCQKMRMIGADFWELPDNISESNNSPIEYAMKPKYRNQLGFYWNVFEKDEPYFFNLTEAQRLYGPGLRGYNNVRSYDNRGAVVRSLGGIWCGQHLEQCNTMWCSQYPEHCYEKDKIDDFLLVHSEWTGSYGWRGAIFWDVKRDS